MLPATLLRAKHAQGEVSTSWPKVSEATDVLDGCQSVYLPQAQQNSP